MNVHVVNYSMEYITAGGIDLATGNWMYMYNVPCQVGEGTFISHLMECEYPPPGISCRSEPLPPGLHGHDIHGDVLGEKCQVRAQQ